MGTFRLRKFSNPDALRAIDPVRLARFLEPYAGYFAARGVNVSVEAVLDYEKIVSVFLTPDDRVPAEMIDALHYVDETSSNEDMDELLERARARGLTISTDLLMTAADVAMQIWLDAPDVLRERHAEAVAFQQKNFLYYGGAHGAPRPFPKIDDELRLRIETLLDDWFEKHRRGRNCRVFVFPEERKTWILIRHGRPLRREAAHRDNGQPGTEVYRPQQHDVLIYDSSCDELGVHTETKGETRLYLSCFGNLVFADEEYFPPADKFSLDPLTDAGASSLLCEDVEGIEKIRLVEYRRYWGGTYGEIEIRRAGDIFAALETRGQKLDTRGRLVAASFKVKFTGTAKERGVTIRPPSNARYERNDDSELIERWLASRGFTLDAKAEGDAEAPSAVLEVA